MAPGKSVILVILSILIQREVVETLVVETGDSINNLQKIAGDYMKEISDRIWRKSENRKLVTDYLTVSKSIDPNGSSSGFKYYNGNGSTQWRLSPQISNSVRSSLPESSTNTQFVRSQTLDPFKNPFIAFSLTSNQVKHHFKVDNSLDRNYYISVVLEKMNCSEGKWIEMYSNDETVPKLSVDKSDNQIVEWCTEVDNSVYNFQSVKHFTHGDKSVIVTGTGNWTNLSASVVVSIYYETSECSECTENNHFCCGTKYSSCTQEVIRELRDDSQPQSKVRCIPKISENGSSLCNGHPNCGFRCNRDESHAICTNGGSNDDDYCVGYYCYNYQQQDRTILTILLLIFCCVIIPFGVFLLCCSRKDIRRECLRGRDRGRCPLPLEIALCPFSIDPEDTGAIRTRRNRHNHNNHEMRNRPRGNQRREATRRSQEVNSSTVPEAMVPPQPPAYDNFSYLDDLPPPYSECVSNKSLYPVPPPVPVTGISTISRNSVTPVPVHDFDLHHHRRPMFTGVEVQAITESNDELQLQQEKESETRGRTVAADAETDQIQPAINNTITVENNDLGAGAGSNANSGQNSRPVCRCNISISI